MFFLTVLQLKHIFLSLKCSFDKNKQQLKTNNLHEANDPPLLVTSPRYTGNQLQTCERPAIDRFKKLECTVDKQSNK